jgi:hypothetical protein
MRNGWLVGLFTALLLLAACKDESRQGYMALQGRIFIFNPRVASAVYSVSVAVLKDLPSGSKLVFTFEDPAGGAPMKKQLNVRGGETKLGLQSDDLQCIKKDRPYTFSVQLLDATGKELQRIDSSITSTLDQSVLPEAPLSFGPTFIPNTALKRGADGKFMRTKPLNCPA